MDNSVIVLDSSDDEAEIIPKETTANTNTKHIKQEIISLLENDDDDDDDDDENNDVVDDNNDDFYINDTYFTNPNSAVDLPKDNLIETKKRPRDPLNCNDLESSKSKVKRIKPTKISDVVVVVDETKSIDNIDSDTESMNQNDNMSSDSNINNNNNNNDSRNSHNSSGEVAIEKTPINSAFSTLLDACRAADSSIDMEQMIQKKLIRYYEMVHPDFVNSKSFSKTALSVAADINANPELVYLKVSGILDELNIRRKSRQTVMSNEDVVETTGNERHDLQIRRLNKALYLLKRKIAILDEADVDLNDEMNSTYLLSERYKKRACEIYEKICDITGESKHAQRMVRKPIVFHDTKYPEFNRTLQAFVNRTKTFPDMFDVLRCLNHCNEQYGFGLNKDQIKTIAQDAFLRIGRLLQKRRKTDLYEMVSFFGNQNDPAKDDQALQTKLIENQKYYSRINDIIDKYAAVQDEASSEHKRKSLDHNLNTDKMKNKKTDVSNVNSEPKQIILDNSDDSHDDDDDDGDNDDGGGGVVDNDDHNNDEGNDNQVNKVEIQSNTTIDLSTDDDDDDLL